MCYMGKTEIAVVCLRIPGIHVDRVSFSKCLGAKYVEFLLLVSLQEMNQCAERGVREQLQT